MSKILVTYFSATGETRFKANELARLLQADIEEIEPISKYTNDDLDWRNIHSRSSVEMNDQNSRPNIIEPKLNPNNYDILWKKLDEDDNIVEQGSGIFNGDIGIITHLEDLKVRIDKKLQVERAIPGERGTKVRII